MDVPAPSGGTVEAVLVKVGDKVSEGTAVVRIKGSEEGAHQQPPSLLSQQEPPPAPRAASGALQLREPQPRRAGGAFCAGASVGALPAATTDFSQVHASPGVRRAARELGVDLSKVKGTGEKDRITKEDVLAFLRGPSAPAPAAGAAGAVRRVPEFRRIPAQDFSKFGPIETKPLSRIKKLSGPHPAPRLAEHSPRHAERRGGHHGTREVPQRAGHGGQGEGLSGYHACLFLKASVGCLRQFPEFNSSLSPEKDALILKRYYHLGIAVDTPDGLVVPVIRDVDRKGITELSQEMGAHLQEGARR